MKRDRHLRVFRWLPWLTLMLVVLTWYAETRMERLEMAGSNLVKDGDFDTDSPGGPAWDIAAPAEGLWQSQGGVDSGAAIRLPSGGVLRYRLGQAHRSDGYFVGLCLRAEGRWTDGDLPRASVQVGKAGVPSLSLAPSSVVRAAADGTWHCGLEVVSVPFGFDELVVETRSAATPGTFLWVDRMTVYPALSPPAYQLVHVILIVAWLLLAAFAVVAVWYPLGPAGGIVVIGAIALVAGVLTDGEQLAGLPLPKTVDTLVQTVGTAMDPIFEALRIFTGDRSWRATGEVDLLSVTALALFGFVSAGVLGWRFRWTERPWGQAFVAGILFALALQALRILLHLPGAATLHWVLDPLAIGSGMVAGAVPAEILVRMRLRTVG